MMYPVTTPAKPMRRMITGVTGRGHRPRFAATTPNIHTTKHDPPNAAHTKPVTLLTNERGVTPRTRVMTEAVAMPTTAMNIHSRFHEALPVCCHR